MENTTEFNRKEGFNKGNKLTFNQIVRANFSKIQLCDLIIPYCLVSDWYKLDIYFTEQGIISTIDDFKKANDVILNSLLYN